MTMNFSTLAVLFSLLLLLLGLGLTVAIDPYIRREHRHIILIIVVLSISLIVQNIGDATIFVNRSSVALRYVFSVYGYTVRPVILILFLSIIQPDGKKWLQWTLAGINAALYCATPFTTLCFSIREADGAWLSGPLWLTCLAVSTILLVELLAQTLFRYREMRKLEHLIPLLIVLSIIVSVVMDLRVGMEAQPVTFLTIAIVVSSVFYYIWLHFQFVRAHERDLMAAQRIQIMMTQIQPHFLFNTIATFKALCRREPEKAADVADKFGLYLRQNLDNLDTTGLIPFDRELQHTRLYAEIEMVRFENVRVDYHIEDRDFALPPLVVQPLVENAIRHGVRVREEGIVRVQTYREAGFHVILIQDNGVGFEPDTIEHLEGHHIGIRNVRERVESMCGGSLTIESRPGGGTAVTICIPQKEDKDESNLRR